MKNGLQGENTCEHLIKVIFVGDAGVGKTCLLERLFSDKFELNTQPTIGCDFRFKRYTVDDHDIGVTLWDTAGAERYSAMTASYFRGAHGIVLVYDVTRRETLTALCKHWLAEVDEHMSSPNVVRLIVGNKIDLGSKREVTPEEGAEVARQHGCLYKETSAAARDENVHDAFVWGLISSILASDVLQGYGHEKLNVEQEAPARKRHPCCWSG